MKKYILSLLILLFLSSCADKTIILVPQSEYYPTFPTSDFNISEKHSLSYYIETEESNGTKLVYAVLTEKEMLSMISNTKKLRSDYNILLKKIKEFNIQINKLNKIQNDKKPQEVDSIKYESLK